MIRSTKPDTKSGSVNDTTGHDRASLSTRLCNRGGSMSLPTSNWKVTGCALPETCQSVLKQDTEAPYCS